MVSRSELKCGEDGMTSSSPDVDRGCVDVIGVDGSFVDVIGVDGSCPFKPRTHKHVYMIPSISIRPQELVHVVASGTKKQVASKRVITMEDTSKMNGESQEATQPTLINKPFVCVVSSGEKRPLTVPKGPNFHCIHVPKSCCTNRVALLV
ncbi:unnamed protein product [Brassica rapa subsp. trilocularis]